MSIQLRRGLNSERATVTPAEGELIYTTDTKILYVGDGLTLGGNQVSTSGLSGTLNGNIDLGSYELTGVSLTITSTGTIIANNISGTFNGALGSNLTIGTHSITNGTNLTLNGSDGNISANNFILGLGSLSSLNTFVSPNNNTIGRLKIADQTEMVFNNSDDSIPFIKVNGITSGPTTSYFQSNISRGTIASQQPVQAGDVLYFQSINGWDGTNYTPSAALVFQVDPNSTVSASHAQGKIFIANFTDNNLANAKFLAFDSAGRLGVNVQNPNYTLDVSGGGSFQGRVRTFGVVNNVDPATQDGPLGYYNIDNSNPTIAVADTHHIDIPAFSGMLIVNDITTGVVATWLCGGNQTIQTGITSIAFGATLGTMAEQSNGYRWTNNGFTGPFTFTVIRTRNTA